MNRDFTDWSEEERKTYVGQMLGDIRGSWGHRNSERLKMILHATDNCDDDSYSMRSLRSELNSDIGVVDKPDRHFDGREYRGCYLYEYDKEITDRVRSAVQEDSNFRFDEGG